MASRGKNFSEREKCKLLELVQKYKHIIENKCTNAISVVKKNEAWEVITQEFNSSGEVLRTTKQLNTAYLNLKRTTRQHVANENVRKYIEQKNSSQDNAGSSSQTTTSIDEPSTYQQIVEINSLLKKLKKDETADKKGVMATGGGLYQPILSNVGAQVLAVMGDQVTPLSNTCDSASTYFDNVLDQGDVRPAKVNTVEQSQSRHQATVEFISEEEEGYILECPLCLSMLNKSVMVRLAWCAHRCCEPCLRQYLAIEIFEARVPVNCPVCHENMHPSDVRRIVDNPVLYDKYEEFSVRRALAADPDTRWCPAPDCSFAVVASGCASCPKLTCLAPGCGASFCYHCKAAWHPTQTCDAARRSRQPVPPRAQQPSHPDLDHGDVKPCPRCSVLIVKVEDGSCNHMVCCVCGAEFCWLCMKEVSDLHYLSPSGCTFWGKKPWSRKKKLLWQLGTLAGAPLGIAVVAGVALPALLVGLPLWAGRRAHRRLRRAPAPRRRAAVAAAVAAALLVSPLVAGLAVGIGVPILLFYVYGVVPVSLCRAGGCAGTSPPSAQPHFDDERDHAPDMDAASRRLEPSIGDASLSAGSAHAEVRAPSLAALAGSLGGQSAPSPAATRLEVTADVAASDSTSAASWPDDLPSTSTSRSAKLRSLFLYGSAAPPPDVEAGACSLASPAPPAPAELSAACETREPRQPREPRSEPRAPSPPGASGDGS